MINRPFNREIFVIPGLTREKGWIPACAGMTDSLNWRRVNVWIFSFPTFEKTRPRPPFVPLFLPTQPPLAPPLAKGEDSLSKSAQGIKVGLIPFFAMTP